MKNKKGFSLIELLIVISIMAILGSLALSAFSTARKQARDSQRKNELIQYKTALESYYATEGSYPTNGTTTDTSTQGGAIFGAGTPIIQNYMGGVALVGVNAADDYLYYYTSDGTTYKLFGDIELPPDSFWVICSNGKSGMVTTTFAAIKDNLTCDVQ